MRLSFPNGEHEDTFIGAGDTSIGAASDSANLAEFDPTQGTSGDWKFLP